MRVGVTEKEDFNFLWDSLGKMLLPLQVFSSIKLKILEWGSTTLPHSKNYDLMFCEYFR